MKTTQIKNGDLVLITRGDDIGKAIVIADNPDRFRGGTRQVIEVQYLRSGMTQFRYVNDCQKIALLPPKVEKSPSAETGTRTESIINNEHEGF